MSSLFTVSLITFFFPYRSPNILNQTSEIELPDKKSSSEVSDSLSDDNGLSTKQSKGNSLKYFIAPTYYSPFDYRAIPRKGQPRSGDSF